MNKYLKTNPDVLDDIINERLDFPIFLIPNKVVDEIILCLDSLSYKNLKVLYSLMPRHISPRFKVLKRTVRAKLNKGLSGFLGFLPIRETIVQKAKNKEKEREIYLERNRISRIMYKRKMNAIKRIYKKTNGRVHASVSW